MDDNEKKRRCEKAFNKSIDPEAYTLEGKNCKVYGRTVRTCNDCAFFTKWDHVIIGI